MPDQRIGVDTTAVTAPVAGDVMLLVNGASTNRHITADKLKAWLGAAAPAPVTATITGNGVLTSWDVAHNLGVTNVRVLLFRADGSQVDDDQFDFVPTVGNTLNSTTITIPEGTPGGPLPNGVALTVYVAAADSDGPFVPTIVRDAGAALALTGDESLPTIVIADVSQDVTVTVTAVGRQVSVLHLVGDGTARTVTWAGDPLSWSGGTPVTTVPSTGRLVVQVADHGDGQVLAIGEVFS